MGGRRYGRSKCSGKNLSSASDRKSTRLNSSHLGISYAVFCLKKKNKIRNDGSKKLNRNRKARVSYKVQRTINASLNVEKSTRAVSSNKHLHTSQHIEITLRHI